MKVSIFNLEGRETSKIELPSQFDEEIRPDLVNRAFLASQSTTRQSYGAFNMAGKRPSAKLSRRRHHYRGAYGYGISRVPRKIISKRGTRMNWIAAFAPGTVSGRRAHPPKKEKNLVKTINKKEKTKAIRSALSSLNLKIAEQKIESLDKAGVILKVIDSFGFDIGKRKLRAGKGKLRRGKYRIKKGPLLVTSADCPLASSGKNLIGIDIVPITSLNITHLAPGGVIGRQSIWSEEAIKKIRESKLFI